MANTYTWTHLVPEVDPDPDNKRELKKVVVSVIGRMQGTDGNGGSATADGRVALDEPDPENFIAHEDLTEQWLEDICERANGEYFRAAIDRQMEVDRLKPVQMQFPSQIAKANSGE